MDGGSDGQERADERRSWRRPFGLTPGLHDGCFIIFLMYCTFAPVLLLLIFADQDIFSDATVSRLIGAGWPTMLSCGVCWTFMMDWPVRRRPRLVFVPLTVLLYVAVFMIDGLSADERDATAGWMMLTGITGLVIAACGWWWRREDYRRADDAHRG